MTATLDFETYSEAGMVYDHAARKWVGLQLSGPAGLPAVGMGVYAMHPSTRILSAAYDLADGLGDRLWVPGCPPPQDLLDYVAAGGLIEASNSGFEFLIWNCVGLRLHGWPVLPLQNTRCTKARALAFGLPAALGAACEVLNLSDQKDKKGTALIKKFCIPRNPTKADDRLSIDPATDPEGPDLYSYNVGDIRAEKALAAVIPELSPTELAVWQLDQRVNVRGVQVDLDAVQWLIAVYEFEAGRLNAELQQLTGGMVEGASQLAKMTVFLRDYCGLYVTSLDADHVVDLLKRQDLHPVARRIIEIRAAVGSANVKKLYAFRLRAGPDGRARDLFEYYKAGTGRWASRGIQAQNMASGGPDIVRADCCGQVHSAHLAACPYCQLSTATVHSKREDWGPDGMDRVIEDAKTGRIFELWPDPVGAITGCLRGLFVSAPGYELISADFTAIEAVVLACMAGEQWRVEVFRTHGKIYEMSAAKISGVPFDDIIRHKKETGQHHPLRKTIGKVAELASGYAGWIGAWKAFGADAFMTEQEIKQAILKWRAESPAIVEFWGGQYRQPDPSVWYFEPQLHGTEGAAISAVLQPGHWFVCCGVGWIVVNDVLFCRLPSGRDMAYHRPRLDTDQDRRGCGPCWRLSYECWNSDSSSGPVGWGRWDTYGGKLVENIVQGVARDILAHAMLNLEAAGYPIVLHVHDEPVSEVPAGYGSIEEYERIMATMPAWCADWPIKAAGGWRGRRYRK